MGQLCPQHFGAAPQTGRLPAAGKCCNYRGRSNEGVLPASPNYTLGENKQIPLPAKLKACRRTPALCTFIKRGWMWRQGGEGKSRESKVWAEKGWDGGARRHQPCCKGPESRESPNLHPQLTTMGLCPKHPLLRAQRRQLPAMPRSSPKILKEKAKRRNYVANPRYTLSCSSPLCYFAHFLQGRVGKLSPNFTYAGSHRGPATWLCAVSMPLPRSPRAGCSVCPATTLFLTDIIIIRALFVCSGSEKEKSQQQVRWPYAGYSHLRHALPARCAKNNDSSEEKERKTGNEEELVALSDAKKSGELRIINWRGGESRGGGKLSSAGPRWARTQQVPSPLSRLLPNASSPRSRAAGRKRFPVHTNYIHI